MDGKPLLSPPELLVGSGFAVTAAESGFRPCVAPWTSLCRNRRFSALGSEDERPASPTRRSRPVRDPGGGPWPYSDRTPRDPGARHDPTRSVGILPLVCLTPRGAEAATGDWRRRVSSADCPRTQRSSPWVKALLSGAMSGRRGGQPAWGWPGGQRASRRRHGCKTGRPTAAGQETYRHGVERPCDGGIGLRRRRWAGTGRGGRSVAWGRGPGRRRETQGGTPSPVQGPGGERGQGDPRPARAWRHTCHLSFEHYGGSES